MTNDLQLNRDFLNANFASWRLQRLASVQRYELSITGHASGIISTSLDFLHTRASVLRNHLLQSEGRLFVFTQRESDPGYLVYELLPAPASDQGLLPVQVAELGPSANEEAVGGAVEAVVDCSLAVVANTLQSPQPAEGASPVGHLQSSDGGSAVAELSTCPSVPSASAPTPAAQQLLLSRGHGDIVLMRRDGDHMSYSNVVHPIRPRLPYTGVRPIVLEAAYSHPNGTITALAWAMRANQPSAAACCELFAVTLVVHQQGGLGGELQLHTAGVRLLLRTKLPPYLALISPGGIALVAFEPGTEGLEEDMEEEEEAPTAPTTTGGLPTSTTATTVANNDDDDSDMDPRTLEQAAARLAHLSSEERAAAGPAPQWADLYKESGPDGVGAMGGEPGVDLAAWRLLGAGDKGGSGGEVKAMSGGKALPPFWRLSCGAHKLLTAEAAVQLYGSDGGSGGGGSLTSPSSPPCCLLGVTDDVDCAVVSVDWWHGAREEGAAEGATLTPQVRHAASLPALAYVAAGKTYKRHLMLAGRPHAYVATGVGAERAAAAAAGGVAGVPLAAVLVESQRFMYLYGTTSVGESYGRQQVVELGLSEGETVLGARLVELGGAGGEAEGDSDGAVAAAADSVVVVVTQRRLLSYRLRRV